MCAFVSTIFFFQFNDNEIQSQTIIEIKLFICLIEQNGKKTEESCELELIGIFQRSLLVSIKKNAQIVLIIEWNTV